MTTKQTRRNGVNRRATKNKSPENSCNRIPVFTSDPVLSLTQRYIVKEAASSDVVTFTLELPIVPFGVSSSTTSLLLPFKSVRLKKLKVWCMYRSEKTIAGNTINVTCLERRLVRPIEWSDTASFNCNAFISKKFDKFDPLGQWYVQSSGESNPELRFQLPKGALLELTFDYIQSDADALNTYGVVGLTSSRLYTNALNSDIEVVGKGYQAVILP